MKAVLPQHALPRHPIAVVAERIGLSQDVLRVWERRYDAVSPARGPQGQRLYSDADVERLALIQAATHAEASRRWLRFQQRRSRRSSPKTTPHASAARLR